MVYKSDPFSQPTVGYWEVDYKNEEILESEIYNPLNEIIIYSLKLMR